MIVKIIATYENGTEATFTGDPVDLSTIPTEAPTSSTPTGPEQLPPETAGAAAGGDTPPTGE